VPVLLQVCNAGHVPLGHCVDSTDANVDDDQDEAEGSVVTGPTSDGVSMLVLVLVLVGVVIVAVIGIVLALRCTSSTEGGRARAPPATAQISNSGARFVNSGARGGALPNVPVQPTYADVADVLAQDENHHFQMFEPNPAGDGVYLTPLSTGAGPNSYATARQGEAMYDTASDIRHTRGVGTVNANYAEPDVLDDAEGASVKQVYADNAFTLEAHSDATCSEFAAQDGTETAGGYLAVAGSAPSGTEYELAANHGESSF
jgi:hypothetical protein